MKKILFSLAIILSYENCTFKTEYHNQIIIDKEIQKKVESEVIDTIEKNQKECELNYLNKLYLEFYSNDSLQKDSYTKVIEQFCSYWIEEGDTTNIYGFFGGENLTHFGFKINVVKRIPKVYFIIRPHLARNFSYTKDGEKEFNMDIPTKKSKVTLSKMPDNTLPTTICGLVEFETTEFFYVSKYENGEEVPNQRDRVRCNMKIYFKTNKCDSL